MRTNLKLFKILMVLIINTSCVNEVTEEVPTKKTADFMNKYFSKYSFVYSDISSRGNKNYGNQYALFEISKKNIIKNDLEEIYKKIESDGWRIIDKKSNYREYCFGENTSVSILYPLNYIETDSKGVPISFDNRDMLNIFYYFSTTKISECKKNPDIIDFSKI